MKGKLIKTGHRYILYDEGGHKMATTSESPYKKLSLKNCQAIERGYDLDELANGEYRNFPSKANGEEPLPRWGEDQHASKKQKAYKKGFQKALSILGDKKFSHGQMLNAMDLVWEWMNGEEYGCGTLTEVQDNYIQSLQQTEWDVTIEIGCCGNYTPPCNNNCEYGSKPLLDKDGCLILKRI